MPNTGRCRITYRDALQLIEFLASSGVDFDNLSNEYSDADKLQVKFWVASIIEIAVEFGRLRQELILLYAEKDEEGEIILVREGEDTIVANLPEVYFIEITKLLDSAAEKEITYPPHLMAGIIDISAYTKKLLAL